MSDLFDYRVLYSLEFVEETTGFSPSSLEDTLNKYGEQGFRVISTLILADNKWMLIMSRHKVKETRHFKGRSR